MTVTEEKAGVKEHNSKKAFEKNEHACSMEGIFEVSFRIPLPVRTYSWPVRLGQIKFRLSSISSEIDGRNPNTPMGLTGMANCLKDRL